MSRRNPRLLARALSALLLASPAAVSPAAAATVLSIAPGSEDPQIAGMAIEDFEDTMLFPGLSVTFSTWRNAANTVTADPPVTYTGTLSPTWLCSSDGLPGNAWDGTHALVNGRNHDWQPPYAASIELTFSPPRSAIGVGLSNFQRDTDSGLTFHSLYINGVLFGNLESLTGWVSNVFGHNRYLKISGEPIASIRFTANTHYDGMVLDKLAIGDQETPARASSWGRLKSLYR